MLRCITTIFCCTHSWCPSLAPPPSRIFELNDANASYAGQCTNEPCHTIASWRRHAVNDDGDVELESLFLARGSTGRRAIRKHNAQQQETNPTFTKTANVQQLGSNECIKSKERSTFDNCRSYKKVFPR